MISQELFEEKVKELIIDAGWRVKQSDILRTYDKVKYVHRKAFENAIKDMDLEQRWVIRVFVQMCWNHHGKIKDDDQYARDAHERRILHEDRKNSRTADCEGGDKCRGCQETYCDAVARDAKAAIMQMVRGMAPGSTKNPAIVNRLHAELGRKYPTVGDEWDRCADREAV